MMKGKRQMAFCRTKDRIEYLVARVVEFADASVATPSRGLLLFYMKLLVFAVMFAVTRPLVADTETVDGYSWSYIIVDGHVEITYVEPRRGVVTIPSSLGGKLVKGIGSDAFQNSGFTDVTINNGVNSIGQYAFYNCTSLARVTMPNTVVSIGLGAFSGCDKLVSIVMSNGLTDIGESAFWGCRELPEIRIPDSVTSIGAYAFLGCRKLKSITIPDGVTYIGNQTFSWCYMLTDVKIPDSVTDMGHSVFIGCTSLTNVVIGTGLKRIGSSAFRECSSLTSITIPQNVTDIGGSAFQSCSNLICVAMGSGVKSINEDAFRDCVSLVDIVLPDSVTDIKDRAFSECSSLSYMIIPKSVTCIGKSGARVFPGCIGLTNIHFMGSPPEIRCAYYSAFQPITKGTYLPEYRTAWEAVIDKDGYWKGLEMSVYEPPSLPLTLTAESADWVHGSIVLRCMDADTSGEVHTYTLQYYDGNTWQDISNVQSASAGARLTDNGYSSRLGGILPVKYRVRDEYWRVSAECVTRNRHGLFVGVGHYSAAYQAKVKLQTGYELEPLPKVESNTKRYSNMAQDLGRFEIKDLIGSNAMKDTVDAAFVEKASSIIPGDIFLFYVATHGDFDGTDDAILSLYDDDYSDVSLKCGIDLIADKNAAVICILSACKSEALLRQERANVAVIAAANYRGSSDYLFDYILMDSGWKEGWAGTSGVLTFGALADYIEASYNKLFNGILLKEDGELTTREVNIGGNRGMLSRIKAGSCGTHGSLLAPAEPLNFTASQALQDRIKVSWTGAERANFYLIFYGGTGGGVYEGFNLKSETSVEFLESDFAWVDSSSETAPVQFMIRAFNKAKEGVSPNAYTQGWVAGSWSVAFWAGKGKMDGEWMGLPIQRTQSGVEYFERVFQRHESLSLTSLPKAVRDGYIYVQDG